MDPTAQNLTALYLVLFVVKHFVADGPLQTSYQHMNKGDLRHPGGYLHAGIHALASAPIVLAVSAALWWILIAEYIVHFLCDWLKVKLTFGRGWASCGRNEQGVECLQVHSSWFFFAFLADQAVHMLTYIAMVWVMTGGPA